MADAAEKSIPQPDYQGFEAAKRQLPMMSPEDYTRAIRKLAERFGV